MKEAALDLAGRLEDFFSEGRRLWWPSDRHLRRRSLEALGLELSLYLTPWRARRRPGGGTPPPAGPDVGERVIREETLWEGGGTALTPNRYPVAPDHLLLWEKAPLREPREAFLELLARLCRERWDILAFVNSIGAAATVSRAHAQIARLGSPPPLAAVPAEIRHEGSITLSFPPEEGPWPAFFARLEGDPGSLASVLARLVRLRLCPAFNLVFHRDRAWIFFRRRETCSSGYPLPVGALELSGIFFFEEESSFRAMTPEGVRATLEEAAFPPGGTSREVVLAALA